jgi:hypothetical protein
MPYIGADGALNDARQAPGDFLRTIGSTTEAIAYHRRAKNNRVSLSVQMQRDLAVENNSPLDAYCQTLMAAGIRTRSLMGEGVLASEWGEFIDSPEKRALAIEYARRQFVSSMTGRRIDTRSIGEPQNFGDRAGLITSQDFALNTPQNPLRTDPTPRWDAPLVAQIPVSELVAFETGINGTAYQAIYLEHNTAAQRLVRVSEGAEIPRTRIRSGKQALTIYKFGRALEQTYEELRRQTVDHVGFLFAEMGTQVELDRLLAAIGVLIEGDGNNNAADVFTQQELDASANTAGVPTLRSWLNFKMKLKNPYVMTHILTTDAVGLELLLLSTGSSSIPLVIAFPGSFGGFQVINNSLGQTVRMGTTDDVPTGQIVGFDARRALERVYEIGSDISETENFILNQTKVITMTMVEGYAKRDKNAAVVYDTLTVS